MSIYKHEEKYRGKELMAKFAGVKLCICGAGAIGSNLAEHLARQGFMYFRVIDFDRVEEHNINNQIYTLQDTGSFKVAALESRLYDINKSFVNAIHKKLEKDNVKKYLSGADLVIDCFDNISSRQLVTDWCRKNKLECLHLGVNINFGEGVWNDNYKLPEVAEDAVDACDYPLARNIVLSVVVVGSELIIDYVSNHNKRNFVVSLKNFNINYF
jgi:hypothetical protein